MGKLVFQAEMTAFAKIKVRGCMAEESKIISREYGGVEDKGEG